MTSLNDYPNAENFPQVSFKQAIPPPEVDPDEGELLVVAYNPLWTPVLMSAVNQLRQPATWIGSHDEIIRALNRATNLQFLLQQAVAVLPSYPTPFWDDTTDLNDEAPAETQTWYGEVTDPEAPADELTWQENASIWLITGFLAYSGDIGSAIFFNTIAPRFVLAFNKGDLREIWRIVVDASDAGAVDTDDYGTGDVIELNVIADPENATHDVYVIRQAIP